jgi:hypothetical protein
MQNHQLSTLIQIETTLQYSNSVTCPFKDYYRIYSPISRFAYKSVGIFKVILKVFEIDSPISRYHFSTELVYNFRSIFCYLYWRQIKISNKRRQYSMFLLNQINTIALIHFTCMLLNRYLTL